MGVYFLLRTQYFGASSDENANAIFRRPRAENLAADVQVVLGYVSVIRGTLYSPITIMIIAVRLCVCGVGGTVFAQN